MFVLRSAIESLNDVTPGKIYSRCPRHVVSSTGDGSSVYSYFRPVVLRLKVAVTFFAAAIPVLIVQVAVPVLLPDTESQLPDHVTVTPVIAVAVIV